MDNNTPKPGKTLFAISCPRNPDTAITRHTFTCANTSKTNEIKITKAKLAANCWVKTVVCVKKPGPTEDVAIKNAAPSKTLLVLFLFFKSSFDKSFAIAFSDIAISPFSCCQIYYSKPFSYTINIYFHRK